MSYQMAVTTQCDSASRSPSMDKYMYLFTRHFLDKCYGDVMSETLMCLIEKVQQEFLELLKLTKIMVCPDNQTVLVLLGECN